LIFLLIFLRIYRIYLCHSVFIISLKLILKVQIIWWANNLFTLSIRMIRLLELFLRVILWILTQFFKLLANLLNIQLIAMFLIFMNEITDPASTLLITTIQLIHFIFQMGGLTDLTIIWSCFTYWFYVINQYIATLFKLKLAYIIL
jgi:hypothetical protein